MNAGDMTAWGLIGSAVVGTIAFFSDSGDARPELPAATTHTEVVALKEINRLREAYPPAQDVTWTFRSLSDRDVWGLAYNGDDNLIEIESEQMHYLDGEPVTDDMVRYVVRHELGHQITYDIYENDDAAESRLERLFTGEETDAVDGLELSADVIAAVLNDAGPGDQFSAGQLAAAQSLVDTVGAKGELD